MRSFMALSFGLVLVAASAAYNRPAAGSLEAAAEMLGGGAPIRQSASVEGTLTSSIVALPGDREEYLMSDTRTAIDARDQRFMTNFGQQDAAGMASLYTAD